MSETQTLPPQHQEHQPGRQWELTPQPQTESKTPGSNRLRNRVLLVTGGDSGIGRAVAVLAAKEGANVAIAYLEEALKHLSRGGRDLSRLGRRFIHLRPNGPR